MNRSQVKIKPFKGTHVRWTTAFKMDKDAAIVTDSFFQRLLYMPPEINIAYVWNYFIYFICNSLVLLLMKHLIDIFFQARLIVSSSLSPCVIVMGVLIARNYHESKNLIFRTVGAHATLQELCRTMFVYFDLLKADLQVSVRTLIEI
jgi:hypothetical protein